MPDSPDFEQMARTFLDGIDEAFTRADADKLVRVTAEQLRQVWNARGAADLQAIDAGAPYSRDGLHVDVRQQIGGVIRQLDR
jgi:hypothetical protein